MYTECSNNNFIQIMFHELVSLYLCQEFSLKFCPEFYEEHSYQGGRYTVVLFPHFSYYNQVSTTKA